MKQHDSMIEAISALMNQQPFFAVLLANLMKVKPDETVQTAATDGVWILYNPKWFGKLTVKERVFVLAHEVMHCILQHIPRAKAWADRAVGPDFKVFSYKRWNKAGDYIINQLLTADKIGDMPHGGLRDHHIATGNDIVDEVYPKIPEDDEDKKGGGQPGGDHGGFGTHLPAPLDDSSQLSDQELKAAVSSAANAAKAQGKMPAGLERLVGEIMEPTKNWKELLRSELLQELGTDAYTMRRLNKRMLRMFPSHPLILPGTAGYSSSTVVVQIDTSGSIGQEEIAAFMGEVSGILTDGNPMGTIVLWVDAKVAGVDELPQGTPASELTNLKPKGGGGTDMCKGFDWIHENGIDQLPDGIVHVILTDGYTPWPNYSPGWPVIVLSSTDQKAPDWASTIHFDG
jgi:predicted metal-dependent peptidase